MVKNKMEKSLIDKDIPVAFKFLLSEKFDFSISIAPIRDKSAILEELARKYDCVASERVIKDIVKNNIKKFLSGNAVSKSAFRKLEKYIAVSYYAGDSNFKSAFLFLHYLRAVINEIDVYSADLSDWLSAKGELENLLLLTDMREDSVSAMKILGEAVMFFRDKGFTVDVEINQIKMPTAENDRLMAFFQKRLSEMGFWGARLALEEIEKFFQTSSHRYYLNHAPSLTSPPQLQVPWGFIFKAALSHYYPTPRSESIDKKFWATVQGLTQYLCLYELQKHHLFDFYDIDTIMSALNQKIMYDNVFSIPQTNPHHLFKLLSGIVQIFLADHPELQIYLDIFMVVLKRYVVKKSIFIEKWEFNTELKSKYSVEDIRSALTALSFRPKDINLGYDYPEKTKQLNYFTRPFIFNGAHYICLNIHFVGMGFFFAIYQVLLAKGLSSKIIDTTIGNGAEEYLGLLFNASGITVLAGKEYKLPSDKRKLLGTKREKGECDFIIETSTHIIFLELKAKNLNASSRGGDIIQATDDLSKSLFHGLAQTGWHELLLRLDGKISFTDGTALHWNNREIERVTVSMLDFYSIGDSNFVHQLLQNLLGSKISSSTNSVPKGIHQYMDELYLQYNHQLFSHYRTKQNPFWNCSFFSIPQLMIALEGATNNESFYKELFSVRTFTVGGNNWYQDYYAKKSLQHTHS